MYADVVRPQTDRSRTASRLVKSGQGINLPGFSPLLCQWPISKVFRASEGFHSSEHPSFISRKAVNVPRVSEGFTPDSTGAKSN